MERAQPVKRTLNTNTYYEGPEIKKPRTTKTDTRKVELSNPSNDLEEISDIELDANETTKIAEKPKPRGRPTKRPPPKSRSRCSSDSSSNDSSSDSKRSSSASSSSAGTRSVQSVKERNTSKEKKEEKEKEKETAKNEERKGDEKAVNKDKAEDDKASRKNSESVSVKERNTSKEKKEEKEKEKETAKNEERKGDEKAVNKDKAEDDKASRKNSESVSVKERNTSKEKKEEKEKEKETAKNEERKGDEKAVNKDKAEDDKATQKNSESVSVKERNNEKKEEEKEKEKQVVKKDERKGGENKDKATEDEGKKGNSSSEKNNKSDRETTEAVKNLQNLMMDLSTPKKNIIPLTPSNSPLKDVEGCFSPYTSPETSPLKGYAPLTADIPVQPYFPSASSTCTATAPPPLVGIGVNTPSLLQLEQIKQNRVILNISGARYITSKISIMNDKDSLLAEIFKPNSPFTKTSTFTYYFDRDHTHFRHILNYLRNRCQVDLHTLPRDGAALRELLIEARYYRLKELELAILTKMNDLQTVQTFGGWK